MYHDQGLTPFKALSMDSGVNFTAGLPFVRTSPDHGTGYDIAGKGLASPASLREAVYAAIDIYRNRQNYDEAYRRPLRRQHPEKKRKRTKHAQKHPRKKTNNALRRQSPQEGSRLASRKACPCRNPWCGSTTAPCSNASSIFSQHTKQRASA